jgi:hypothetical protein
MSIYNDLLFLQGHIADVALARALATTVQEPTAAGDAPVAAAATGVAATEPRTTAEPNRTQAHLRRTMTALSPFR